MRFHFIVKFLVLTVLYCTGSQALAENSLEFEWDPYYSNVGYYISLTDSPIPEVTEDDEAKVYDRLILRPSFKF